MQCDFLLKRNAYSVDDEDVRSAFTGYGMYIYIIFLLSFIL